MIHWSASIFRIPCVIVLACRLEAGGPEGCTTRELPYRLVREIPLSRNVILES